MEVSFDVKITPGGSYMIICYIILIPEQQDF